MLSFAKIKIEKQNRTKNIFLSLGCQFRRYLRDPTTIKWPPGEYSGHCRDVHKQHGVKKSVHGDDEKNKFTVMMSGSRREGFRLSGSDI